MELSTSDFLLKFSEFSNKEFNLHNTDVFLEHLAFEKAIEIHFKSLLLDYKTSYDKLKRPILKDEIKEFIKEKETPVKLYFQYLKEYLFKMVTSTNVANYSLFFLTESYKNYSICDIFAITNDFSLKYNILYALFKISTVFVATIPEDIKSTHYKTLYDIFLLYSDSSQLKWVDFSSNNLLSFLGEKPKYLIIQSKNEIFFISEKEKNNYNIEIIINLEEEHENYIKSLQEDVNLDANPNDYVERIVSILKEKHPNTISGFKLKEEIKLAAAIHYLKDFEDKITYKRNLNYFYLGCYLSHEIIKTCILY